MFTQKIEDPFGIIIFSFIYQPLCYIPGIVLKALPIRFYVCCQSGFEIMVVFVPFYRWESWGREVKPGFSIWGLWSLVCCEINLVGNDKHCFKLTERGGEGEGKEMEEKISECKPCGIISSFFFQYVCLCVYNEKYCKRRFYMRILQWHDWNGSLWKVWKPLG